MSALTHRALNGLDPDQHSYLNACLGYGLAVGDLIQRAAVQWQCSYDEALAAAETVAVVDGLSVADAARVLLRGGAE